MDKVYLVYLEEDSGEYPQTHLYKICSSKDKAEKAVESITPTDILENIAFRNTEDFKVIPDEDRGYNYKGWSVEDSRGWLAANVYVWIDGMEVE